MKIGIIVFAILLGIIVTLCYPFSIKLKLHFSLTSLVCLYCIKVLNIKLLCGKTFIDQDDLVIQNTHNLIYSSSKNTKKQQAFLNNIIKKLCVSRAEVYFSGGIKDNAYISALMCGYAYIFSSAISSIIISSNPLVHIFSDIDPIYNKNILDISIKALLEISLLDIIIAKIKTIGV